MKRNRVRRYRRIRWHRCRNLYRAARVRKLALSARIVYRRRRELLKRRSSVHRHRAKMRMWVGLHDMRCVRWYIRRIRNENGWLARGELCFAIVCCAARHQLHIIHEPFNPSILVRTLLGLIWSASLRRPVVWKQQGSLKDLLRLLVLNVDLMNHLCRYKTSQCTFHSYTKGECLK